jgi:serine protease Do
VTSALTEWAAARRALADSAASSVIGIDSGRGVQFSGIAWGSEILVTAAEALHGADSVTVHTRQGTFPAAILACDLSVDVAILKAQTGSAAVSVAPPAALSWGDDVLIAGRSHMSAAARWAQVEELGPAWRSRSGGALNRLIRLSSGLHRTLEGGGVFDLEGRLCAMAVQGPRHTTLGIPVETIERIVTAVQRHGHLPRPYLGVRLQPVRLDAALQEQLSRACSEATLIIGVEPGSPAKAAGLMFGDLLLSVAGQLTLSAIDLKVALSLADLGSSVPVQVYRASQRVDTSVLVRERSRP